MEPLIKYISENPTIQTEIIYDEAKVYKALYYLLMHHNYSVEFFLKALFQKGFNKNNIYFFRENSRELSIICSYLDKNGGNFTNLAQQIRNLACKENVSKICSCKKNANDKIPKKMKNIISKSLDIIDTLLFGSMSSILIDYCAELSVYLNTYFEKNADPNYGQKLLCSFILFKIITPKVIAISGNEQLPHVIQLLKYLNTITLQDDLQFCAIEHYRIKNIIAKILMRRKKVRYNSWYVLTPKKYMEKCNLIVTKLQNNSLEYEHLNSINQILKDSKRNKNNKCILKKRSTTYNKDDLIPQTNLPILNRNRSFQQLLYRASPRPGNTMDIDPKYILAWTSDELVKYLVSKKIDTFFFKRWKIDGKSFMQLTKNSLEAMGCDDPEQIGEIISCIKKVKLVAIDNFTKLNKRIVTWSQKDLVCWLIFSGMAHLVDIFMENNITPIKFSKMDVMTYLSLEIRQPTDIMKLLDMKKKM